MDKDAKRKTELINLLDSFLETIPIGLYKTTNP